MFQTIIVYIIIAFAIAYAVYAVVKNIRKKEPSSCDDCDGCDLKNEITKNCLNKTTKDSGSCGCGSK